jgi:hypothetical protein
LHWGQGYDPLGHAESLGAEVFASWKVSGWGDYRAGRIRYHPRLTQAEARCTVAHEVVHHEHRDDILGYCGVGWLDGRLEHRVHIVAARRLVVVSDLAEAVRWSDHPYEIAEQLVVDTRTLYVRALGLSVDDYRELRARARGSVRRSLDDIRRQAAIRLPTCCSPRRTKIKPSAHD